eukprot:TRINITY_DN4900_c0_g1_i2.p4 TRINITY_DN4900_c0_g1~~TRINITY_DN4900_c0_g1_i2.p4  ORF type:complete len:107 (+),score=20.36 TRINITY_DN4900_c0_g1_i2:444-764(+)
MTSEQLRVPTVDDTCAESAHAAVSADEPSSASSANRAVSRPSTGPWGGATADPAPARDAIDVAEDDNQDTIDPADEYEQGGVSSSDDSDLEAIESSWQLFYALRQK